MTKLTAIDIRIVLAAEVETEEDISGFLESIRDYYRDGELLQLEVLSIQPAYLLVTGQAP